jgi:hypothetical protein
VGSKVHGGTTAAPMIADVFKQLYRSQTQLANGTRRRRVIEPPGPQNIRRAQPVDEDESD